MTGGLGRPVAVVTPVFGNAATLGSLAHRLSAAMERRPWRLRIVIDGSPDDSARVAQSLASRDDRLAVTVLATNVGQHRALLRGLADEPDASAWVCLDADLQDPPEALPALLDRLSAGDVNAVFAGRRGRYEPTGRLLGGRAHRSALAWLTGLPRDAGAFVALDGTARAAVLDLGGPSLVAAVGVAGVPVTSVPVERAVREVGRSSWTSPARVRQSVRTLAWTARARFAPSYASHRWTSTSE